MSGISWLRRTAVACVLLLGMIGAAVLVVDRATTALGASAPQAPPVNAVPVPPQTPGPGTVPPLSLELPFSKTPSPEELQRSRTAYEDLGAQSAVSLAKQTFGIESPSWVPPGSEPGTRVTGYLSTFTASEERPEHDQVLVQSTVPLRVTDEAGNLHPVSLSLREEGSAYLPQSPLVPISIAKDASAGVSLLEAITVSPGEASPSASVTVTGNRVVWPDVATDTDYMAEPVPWGVETSWQLRSERSPQESSLVFHLGPEESLRMSSTLHGAAEVVRGAQPLFLIPPVIAQQADGEALPVYYSISGDVLTTHVNLQGSVDFPVLVDPEITAYYGEANNDNAWQNWYHHSNISEDFGHCEVNGHFCFLEYGNLIQVGTNPGSPTGSWGEWYTGVNPSNAARITRVDVGGLTHQWENQSVLAAGIRESNGSGIWTTNGYAGAMGPQPLATWQNYGNTPMAFCADGAGGTDNNEGKQPLCNDCKRWEGPTCAEAYGGTAFDLWDSLQEGRQGQTVYNYSEIHAAYIRYIQTANPTADLESPYRPPERWFNSQRQTQYVRTYTTDPGLGVARAGVDYAPGEINAEAMHPYGSKILPGSYVFQAPCNDPFCYSSIQTAGFSLSGLGTGVWTVAGWGVNAVNSEAAKGYFAYIDNTPPEIAVPSWGEASFGPGQHTLTFSAQDGHSGAPQSGVHWVALEVDGRAKTPLKEGCAETTVKPTGTPCSALSDSWTFNSEDLAPGPHTIKLRAQDWVGNESSPQTYQITINRSVGETQQVGPGTLNLVSGDYKIATTDASFPAGVADLTVSRTYDSHSTSSGPLGPGWTLSTPDASADGQWQTVKLLPSGNVEAVTTSGLKAQFEPVGEAYRSPAGYQSYTLTKPSSNPVIYQITDAGGDYTQFEQPSGATSFVPTTVAQAIGAGGLNSVSYQVINGKTTEIRGPEAAGISCKTKPLETRGCRTLVLRYTSSTAPPPSGEAPSAWGEYPGQLAEVNFTAWDPEKGEMTTTPVAQYAYDSKGRLRAEWDPRISPTLKTIYGYDSEGRLTAESPAGQQPVLFAYGTTAGASGKSWLLSITRPGATTALGKGPAPANTTPPTLSSATATVGTTLKVQSNGKWSNSPLAYSYQWQDCTINPLSGSIECSAITGATSQSYTPQHSDEGRLLAAQVTATNAFGSQVAETARTGPVQGSSSTNNPPPAAPKPGKSAVTTIEYRVPAWGAGAPYQLTSAELSKWTQKDAPAEATAILPPDEPQGWPAASYKRATLYYFDASQRRVNVAAPGGAISMTEYDPYGNVERSLTPGNRRRAIEAGANAGEELDTKSEHSKDGAELLNVRGPKHRVKLATGTVTEARAFTRYSYDEGAPAGGPYRLVTKASEGALPVGGGEADVRTVKKSYSGQNNLGWQLHKPTSVTIELQPGHNATRTTVYDPATGDVTESSTPAASGEARQPIYGLQFGKLGAKAGQLKNPTGLAVDSGANVWISDTANNRIDQFSAAGNFIKTFGWGVSDGKAELEACASSCRAGLSGAGDGELSEPQGVTYDQANGSLYVSDSNNDRIEEFSTNGAFNRAFGWGVSDGKGEREICSSGCQAGLAGSGPGQLAAPQGLTSDGGGNVWVADSANSRLEKFSAEGEYLKAAGKQGAGSGEFSQVGDVALCKGSLYATDLGGERIEQFSSGGAPQGQFGESGEEDGQFKQISRIACDPENGALYVTDQGANRVEIFTETGKFVGSFGSSGGADGQLTTPIGVDVSASGTAYVLDAGNSRVETWASTNPGAHTTQTIYYSAKANAKYSACGNHPEWANLPCLVRSAAQPEDALPSLPEASTTYNVWDQPATATRTAGSDTRTATISYDGAGRAVKSAISSTKGRPLPAVVDEYSSQTGALVKQGSEGTGKAITSVHNSLGQLTSYTDADGNTSTYGYDIDGRVTEAFDGKYKQTSTYDSTTGQLKTLKDGGAGTFSATYDAEGQLEKQTYPNGMKAEYDYNETGQATSLVYAKGKANWYEDAITPSIHGQWLDQTSTLAKDSYAYDNAGRLIEVNETPTGKDCTTQLYTYDDDSNRTAETERKSSSETCVSSGGATVYHSYDTADRLADPEAQYESLGANTLLPGPDAGGHPLESSYYADGSLYSQSQNAQTNVYAIDPAGRVRGTVNETTSGVHSSISHYSGSGSTPAWTAEGTAFTRKVAGIGGGLCALQTASEITLEISNLHGDIVGTVLDNKEAKPTLTSEPTAFGVPTSNSKYGWLGSGGIETSFQESGIASTSGGSYVPQVAIHLEPAGLSAGPLQDPVNEYLANNKEAEASSEWAGPGPGAIEPVHVDTSRETEFWEHPPWDKPPENTPEEVEIDPSHEFTHKDTRFTYENAYGRLVVDVVYKGDGTATLFWSLALSPALAAEAIGPASEVATIYTGPTTRLPYFDSHPSVPATYMFHSKARLDVGVHYQLAINIRFPVPRGTRLVWSRLDFIIGRTAR
jgi:YD repeat-containing protein